MSDAQLLSYFNRLEKILNETKIYTKLMGINKEGLAPNYYDEDELLFPIEIGHEMYNKTLKVYLESKAYIESIEKTLNKCVDSIGKNEKTSHLINSKYNSNSNSNNNNSSSSSDDEPTSKNDQVGQKRKSKKMAPGSSKVNKRPKQPPSSDREDNSTTTTTSSTTTSTSTSTSNKDKSSEKEREKEKSSSSSSEKESNGSHTPSSKEKSQNTTPNKEPSLNGGNSGLNNSGGSNSSSNSSNSNSNNSGNNNSSSSNNGFHGIQSGQLVAARDTKSNQWILAKVNSFSAKTQKYEVIDEDEEEPKRFSVGQKDIIQLPSLSNLPPTFPINTKVLAMFPDTTAFYPAVVVNVQKVKGKPTSYHLHFEDDQDNNGETPNRRVNAQHVISLNK